MFGVASSRVVHRRATCGGVRFDALPTRAGRAWCKRCPVECVSCGTTLKARAACHGACLDCAPLLAAYAREAPGFDGAVRCPCGSGDVLFDAPPSRPPASPPRRGSDAVSAAVARVAVPRCPWCDAPYFDFDACCALRCDCGGHFCAFCHVKCATSRACHEHVRTCARNPNAPDLFASTRQLEELFCEWQRDAAWREVSEAASRSTAGALRLLVELHRNGIFLSPRCGEFAQGLRSVLAVLVLYGGMSALFSTVVLAWCAYLTIPSATR